MAHLPLVHTPLAHSAEVLQLSFEVLPIPSPTQRPLLQRSLRQLALTVHMSPSEPLVGALDPPLVESEALQAPTPASNENGMVQRAARLRTNLGVMVDSSLSVGSFAG